MDTLQPSLTCSLFVELSWWKRHGHSAALPHLFSVCRVIMVEASWTLCSPSMMILVSTLIDSTRWRSLLLTAPATASVRLISQFSHPLCGLCFSVTWYSSAEQSCICWNFCQTQLRNYIRISYRVHYTDISWCNESTRDGNVSWILHGVESYRVWRSISVADSCL